MLYLHKLLSSLFLPIGFTLVLIGAGLILRKLWLSWSGLWLTIFVQYGSGEWEDHGMDRGRRRTCFAPNPLKRRSYAGFETGGGISAYSALVENEEGMIGFSFGVGFGGEKKLWHWRWRWGKALAVRRSFGFGGNIS